MLKISVITPNYNYSSYIGQTIESVVNQDYHNIEHIIVDDGSTDNSIEIIESYVNRYPGKVKLIKQKNLGQTNALNRALREVSGDIIAWINSDDYYCDGVFHKIISEFIKNPMLDAVFGDIIIDKNGQQFKRNKYLPFSYASGVFNGFGKIISSNAIFWKRELFETTGLFDNTFNYAMDSEYWSRLLYKRKVKHISLYVASFRWHPVAKTMIRRDVNSIAYITANQEDKKIFESSYSNLFISNIIPVNYSGFLKIIYKFKRLFLRLINGHYFIK